MIDLFPETKTLKVISLWQPWASLIAAGVKRHETRHWPTGHRGPIAIHAAKTVDMAGAPDALCEAVFGQGWQHTLPRGGVVAVGDLVHCRRAETIAEYLTRADLEAGNFAFGRYAWRIDKVRRLAHPIPLVGRQGLFNWHPPVDFEASLGAVIDHAAACRYHGWA